MDVPPEPRAELPVQALLPAEPRAEFDELAALARRVLAVPAAAVSLVDQQRQVMPGASGLAPDVDGTRTLDLRLSFCRHVVASGEPLVVDDVGTHDLGRDNPALTEKGVHAYAGMPIEDLTGRVVGTLCVFDLQPRTWTVEEQQILRSLANACAAQLQLIQSSARAARLAERDRLAGDLYGNALRDLLSLGTLLGRARSQTAEATTAALLAQAGEDLDHSIVAIRTTIFERSPSRT